MAYKPYTEEEAQALKGQNNFLIPEGPQAFTVIPMGDIYNATRYTEDTMTKGIDKKGNPKTPEPMMRIILKVGDIVFWDHLLFDGPMVHKTRHAAVACGLEADYMAGKLCATSFLGRTGKVVIKHKQEVYNGKTRTVHEIEDYVYDGVLDQQSPTPAPVQDGPPAGHPANGDDDIPF